MRREVTKTREQMRSNMERALSLPTLQEMYEEELRKVAQREREESEIARRRLALDAALGEVRDHYAREARLARKRRVEKERRDELERDAIKRMARVDREYSVAKAADQAQRRADLAELGFLMMQAVNQDEIIDADGKTIVKMTRDEDTDTNSYLVGVDD